MTRLLDTRMRITKVEKQLELARAAVSKGDVRAEATVGSLEEELINLRAQLAEQTNEVVKAEMR